MCAWQLSRCGTGCLVVAERGGVRYLRKSPAVATSLVLDWSDHVGVAPIELGRGVHVKRLKLLAKGSFQGLGCGGGGRWWAGGLLGWGRWGKTASTLLSLIAASMPKLAPRSCFSWRYGHPRVLWMVVRAVVRTRKGARSGEDDKKRRVADDINTPASIVGGIVGGIACMKSPQYFPSPPPPCGPRTR